MSCYAFFTAAGCRNCVSSSSWREPNILTFSPEISMWMRFPNLQIQWVPMAFPFGHLVKNPKIISGSSMPWTPRGVWWICSVGQLHQILWAPNAPASGTLAHDHLA